METLASQGQVSTLHCLLCQFRPAGAGFVLKISSEVESGHTCMVPGEEALHFVCRRPCPSVLFLPCHIKGQAEVLEHDNTTKVLSPCAV